MVDRGECGAGSSVTAILLYAIVTGIGTLAWGRMPVTGRRLWPERKRVAIIVGTYQG